MKFYETTYIAHSALQAGRLDDLTKSINDKVKTIGGEILFSESWGRKKLAYLIDKQKYGTYVFFQFKITSTEKLNDLVQEFEINSNILRHLIVAIEEDGIKERINTEDESKEVIPNDNKVDEKGSTEENKAEETESVEAAEKTESVEAAEKTESVEAAEETENVEATEEDKADSNNKEENLDKE